MTKKHIDSAFMTQDNMIFIKQFGIKTKQHSKMRHSCHIPPPLITMSHSSSTYSLRKVPDKKCFRPQIKDKMRFLFYHLIWKGFLLILQNASAIKECVGVQFIKYVELFLFSFSILLILEAFLWTLAWLIAVKPYGYVYVHSIIAKSLVLKSQFSFLLYRRHQLPQWEDSGKMCHPAMRKQSGAWWVRGQLAVIEEGAALLSSCLTSGAT